MLKAEKQNKKQRLHKPPLKQIQYYYIRFRVKKILKGGFTCFLGGGELCQKLKNALLELPRVAFPQ